MTVLRSGATQGCCCDRRDVAKMLISIDDAISLIVDRATSVEEAEEIAPGHALGRILAAPVRSRDMTPPFDNAAMDGYTPVRRAISRMDIFSRSAHLRIAFNNPMSITPRAPS